MDVCLPELSPDAEHTEPAAPVETTDAQRILADTWLPMWSASHDAEKATHNLCLLAALPLVTTDEALLN